jgi:hypothetical protein
MASAAVVLLLLAQRSSPSTVPTLRQLLLGALGVSIVAVVAMLATMPTRVTELTLGNVYGVLLALAVALGMIVPAVVAWRPQLVGRLALPTLAVLVLAGAFVLRAALLLSAEAV